jgi:hypothetical protein
VHDLSSAIRADADVYRPVKIVEVEAIERRVLDNPESDLAAINAGKGKVGREAKTPANGLTRAVELMSRVLVAWRMDPSLDVAGELRGCERVGERQGPEPVHDGIKDHSA